MQEIPGYEGYYLTENFDIIGRKGLPLSKCCNQSGHIFVNVYNRKKRKNTILYLHRVIGIIHVKGYFDGAVIDHIDRNPKNNDPANLRWTTSAINNLNSAPRKYRTSQKCPYDPAKKRIEKKINRLNKRINILQLQLNELVLLQDQL